MHDPTKKFGPLIILLGVLLFSLQSHAVQSCASVFVQFRDPYALRAFRLVGVDKPYPEILKLNSLEFVSERVADGDARNGYMVLIRYKGQEITFKVTKDKYFTSSAQQAIEGAIRAVEMTRNPELIPSSATATTKFRDSSLLEKLPPGVRRWLSSETERLSREVDVKLTKGFSPSRNFQETAFKPEAGRVFEIEGHWISEDKLTMLEGAPSSSDLTNRFVRKRNGKTEYLLLVHPESRDFYRSLLKESQGTEIFLATPTASSRSMLVWKEGAESSPFVGKLSLDRQIGNILRSLPEGEIAKSMGTDRILIGAAQEFPKDILFLREVLGFMPKGMSEGGFIIRELPKEMLESNHTYIPLFALYGTSDPKQMPFLAEMIQKSGKPPREFILDAIIRPLARHWAVMALKHGLVMEPHAQNVMIELDADNMPTGRFIYRDNGGFTFDLDLRKHLGLFMPRNLPTLSGTMDEVYDQSGHARHYSVSLAKYMEGGFLSQVEAKSFLWAQSGLIPPVGLRPGFTREMLLSQVEQEIQKITGVSVKINRDYSNLNQVMNDLVKRLKRAS